MVSEINFLVKEGFLDTRKMKHIIGEQGSGVVRVEATHCMGMLASEEEVKQASDELAGGEPVWFITPGVGEVSQPGICRLG